MYDIFYTSGARADLKDLDFPLAQRIIRKIYFFSQQKNPLSFAKRLTHSNLGEFRFRIGDYRAIFDVDPQREVRILRILRIRHRKDVYDL